MHLLLSLCLTCALLPAVELLRCYECTTITCVNVTSVECPATSNACRTRTSVVVSGTSVTLRVTKNCSTVQECATPLLFEAEWSVNQGFNRSSHNQLCCLTDNCNFQTVAIPNPQVNGKTCPACANASDTTCTATVACTGVEDKCFNRTTTTEPTVVMGRGCISNNLCLPAALQLNVFTGGAQIRCRAPWSIRLSGVLLAFALTAYKSLV